MRDKELYARILGIRSPWRLEKVKLLASQGEVKIYVEPGPDVMFPAQIAARLAPAKTFDNEPANTDTAC